MVAPDKDSLQTENEEQVDLEYGDENTQSEQ
jgi:hypothetical protein